MHTRPLTPDDVPALEALLGRAPSHNAFHLSALAEHGLASASAPQGRPWAVGVFRGAEVAGVVMALRGTGSIYHTPGDDEALGALAEATLDKAIAGTLSLLSGHATQVGPLLPLIGEAGVGRADECHFRTLYPQDLVLPEHLDGFGVPRLATEEDMEALIDFYEVGFYSLAQLPSRSAWQNRMSEQLAFRSLFVVEDTEGRVASSALSSAEGGGAAMLGGVATLERYRSIGLSALCVGALCEHLFKKGMDSVSLFYLKNNTPAARVYDKLGFRHSGEWILAPLGLGASFGPLLGMRAR